MATYMLGERPERLEDLLVFGIVGTQLEAIAFGHDKCHFEDVDGIEAQTFSVQLRFGSKIVNPHVGKAERVDDCFRDLSF